MSPKTAREIDALQKRIDSYVDKIGDPRTSHAGREFLKVTLKGEYDKLRSIIGGIDTFAESQPEQSLVQYEVYDRHTGNTIPGRGPYNSKNRARRAVDQLDNAYGAYKHGYRPVPVKIKELFEPKANWQWAFKGPEEHVADFKVGNIPYRFTASMRSPKTPDIWDVEFQSMDAKSKRDNKNMSLTGTGNSAEVFSTVADIMKSFLSDKSITVNLFEITAIEPNRNKLYVRMIERLLPNWEVDVAGFTIRVSRPTKKINEAVHKLPLADNDFDELKRLLDKPIPAAVANIFISEIIDDDELNDQLLELENTDPSRDVRPVVVEWINRVMPDQRYRFDNDVESEQQKQGILSPIHGYDPKMYRGTNDPLTGNAYGRY